eukprot:5582376-Pyramimonas_sp.AAC.1
MRTTAAASSLPRPGMPPCRSPDSTGSHVGMGEKVAAASECDREVEYRSVLPTRHLSIVAVRRPPL